ncbi:hypothetical protein [uncultured Methanofollis sp.]|uniref:hypothetical protein n=1 Tax=uncultured Methanofollis sp. TaxID=262500 RepID=UPI002613396D|nr:hypothetical protein [uncultured Methanofollis sp.]
MHNPACLLAAAFFLFPALLAVPTTAGEAVPSFPLVNLTPFGNDSAVNATPAADYRPPATPQDLVRAEADTRGHSARGEMAAETTYLSLTAEDITVFLLFTGLLAIFAAFVWRLGR